MIMTGKPSSFISTFANLLLPEYCALCGASLCLEQAGPADGPLCRDCRRKACAALLYSRTDNIRYCGKCGYPLTSELGDCIACREKNWNFNSSMGLFLYQGIGRDLICAYKFENRRGLSRFFAGHILKFHEQHNPDSIIVPVPFRPASKKKRGWDQIEEIAVILKRYGQVEISSCLFRENGPAQKTMNYQRRLLNLNNKIHFNSKLKAPQEVLLIDDVFTTGATLDYCAGILKKAGTAEVNCIAIALDL